jgi:drug/metabolite transporter (DMT)-like permease
MNKKSNLLVLIFLGLIWSTFAVFTKISVEVFSPYFISFARLSIGGGLLYIVCQIRNIKVFISKNLPQYFVVGFFNSALPFTLFATSSKNLDSGIVSILDGTVPMFEVLISIFILGKSVDKNSILGVFFGIFGIIITSCGNGFDLNFSWLHTMSIIAILIATASYAGASLYINLRCKHIKPMTIAAGSAICAAVILSPSIFFTDFSLMNLKVATSLCGLGFLCTGIAYIFYFKLTAEESPRTAVSVVLLIPVFGTIFGAIFLEEIINITKIIGCITILISMKFILNLSHKSFLKAKEPHIA